MIRRFEKLDWFLFAVGAFLRSLFLLWPIRGDEAYTFLWFAKLPIVDIVSDYSSPNNHILHSILMHFCYITLGCWEPFLRLPVFLSGLAVMYLAWLLAYHLSEDILIARWTLAFCAVSGYLINYSSEGRGYSLVTMFSLLASLLIFSDCSELIKTLGTGVLCFLALWTILTAIVFIIPFYLYLILNDRNVNTKMAISITLLLCVLAYVPNHHNFNAFFHQKQTVEFPVDLKGQYKRMAVQLFDGLH